MKSSGHKKSSSSSSSSRNLHSFSSLAASAAGGFGFAGLSSASAGSGLLSSSSLSSLSSSSLLSAGSGGGDLDMKKSQKPRHDEQDSRMDRRERDKQARERQMQAERDVEPALPIFAAPVKVDLHKRLRDMITADPIATQLITDMETLPLNEVDPDLHGVEESIEPTSTLTVLTLTQSIDDLQTTTSAQTVENIQDENGSPNVSVKRASKPGYKTSDKKHATSTMKFKSFEVNWNKISDALLKRIVNLQQHRLQNPDSAVSRSDRLKKTEICSLVNNVVDQLRSIDTEISAAIMETVARQMVLKYPCLEILDDDGFTNGMSHMTIKYKMINRNTYLNRLDSSKTEAPKLLQKPKYRRAGTVQAYWKTTSNECPKEILSRLRRDEPSLLSDEFLNDSQGYVRSRFDQKKELGRILSEFPVLRRRTLLNYHFMKATGIDISSLRTYFCSKKAKIIQFAANQKNNNINAAASDYEVFSFLASAVGESLSSLVLKKEIGTRIDEIREDSAGPVLIHIDIGHDAGIYYVYAENTRLSEGTDNIICALQDLMTVQYVHSFMYLKSVAKFLELVQEYLLKIFPAKGSKSNAIRIGQQQRTVQKVIAMLSEFETGSSGSIPASEL